MTLSVVALIAKEGDSAAKLLSQGLQYLTLSLQIGLKIIEETFVVTVVTQLMADYFWRAEARFVHVVDAD